MSNIVVAGLLVLHGLVHASYLAPRPPATAEGPAWPFDLGRSRVLSALGYRGALPRYPGVILVAATVGAFGVAGLATVGLVPAALWPVAVALGAGASFAVLAIYFHPWLTLGALIDILLLYAVLAAGWVPSGLSA